MPVVTWFMTRVREEKDGEVEVNKLYDAFLFEMKESGYYEVGKKTFVDHLKKLYPNAKKIRCHRNDSTVTIYKGIVLLPVSLEILQQPSGFSIVKEHLLSKFTIIRENEHELVCDTDSTVKINGNSVFKRVTFLKNKEWELSVCDKKIDLESVFIVNKYQFCKDSVEAVCRSVMHLELCEAVVLSSSVIVTRYHTVENFKVSDQSFGRKVRSVLCSLVVPVNSFTRVCKKCQKMTFGKVSNPQTGIKVNNENSNTLSENDKPVNTTKPVTKNDIKTLIPNASEEMLELLISQVDNAAKSPKGRRWSKPVLNSALQWYCRSPQSYETFRASKSLVLPSPSTLVLYKNKVKQQTGFDKNLFRWMYEEARRRNMPEECWTGGLIMDEMSIQSDIQISKNGDIVELSGLVDTGEEGNLCQIIRTGKDDRNISTHALQFVFLGISGFRFPFAHFMTSGIQAPQLHTLFWEAVDKLQKYGFKVVYVSMDGAQSNRTFMNYNISKTNRTFISPSPVNFGHMIFIMDISHVIKKIRNNVIKSGILKTSTRLLMLPNKETIQWQMFIDCYLWDKQNAFQLHKKLTNEHLFPSTQSKMRNHLAENVLDSEMLHLMQIYQLHLGEKGQILDGVISFLRKTSRLIDILHSRKPVQSLGDKRLQELHEIHLWFYEWESCKDINSKNLMSAQCNEDIHSCIVGFLHLCKLILKSGKNIYITPAFINSDVVENTFNQVRSTYNGANTNPNALQYSRTLNNIIIGQQTVSTKGNASKDRDGAKLYDFQPRPSATKTSTKRKNVSTPNSEKPIKVIRC